MVNSEFYISVTAKANARKIMVLMHVIGHVKRAEELLEYKDVVRVGKADYKRVP